MIKKLAILILITMISSPASATLKNVTEGEDSALVELKVYYSITCSACGSAHISTIEQIKKDYVKDGKVKIEYLPYPLDYMSLGTELFLSCIDSEESHKKALNELMSTHDKWLTSDNPAQGINSIIDKYLTPEQSASCESNVNNFQKLFDKIDVYKKKQIVKGTPAMFVNGKIVKRLSYQHIKYMIDEELKK
jgi:protein-disulfide isomerase